MHDQRRAVVEFGEEVLSAATQLHKLAPDQLLLERFHARRGDPARIGHLDLLNHIAFDDRRELAPDRFYLGKLRQRSAYLTARASRMRGLRRARTRSSNPPINSSPTNTCGIVIRPERFASSTCPSMSPVR